MDIARHLRSQKANSRLNPHTRGSIATPQLKTNKTNFPNDGFHSKSSQGASKRELGQTAVSSLVFILAISSNAFMAGVIWLIQVVHYPLLGEVDQDSIVRVSVKHQTLITRVVAPAMVLEALATGYLFLLIPRNALLPSIFAFLMLMLAVFVTAFKAVPLHSRIARGESHLIRELLRVNWVRTAAWTIKLPLTALAAHQTLA